MDIVPPSPIRVVTPASAVSSVTGSSTFMNSGKRDHAWRFSVRAAGVSAMKKRSNRPRSHASAAAVYAARSVGGLGCESGCSQLAGCEPAAPNRRASDM